MSEKQRFTLWGIHGELLGNEGALVGHLPIVCVGDCSRNYFVVGLKPGWALADTSSVRHLTSGQASLYWGARLTGVSNVIVPEGSIVAVMGPLFRADINQIVSVDAGVIHPEHVITFFDTSQWTPTNDDFCVRCVYRRNLDTVFTEAACFAKNVFDYEFSAAHANIITPRAKSALSIMSLCPGVLPLERFYRIIAARCIEGNTDALIRILGQMRAVLK